MINVIKHVDRAKHPPTITGAFGAAWECDLPALRAKIGKTDQTVAAWLVCAPWAHPIWAYYAICAIYLRPEPGVRPAKINLPGATHEVMVAALDPSHAPDPSDPTLRWLSPMNFVGQWIAQERPNPVDLDRVAAAKIRECVEDIVAARLNPDTDARRQWVARFSDSNLL